MAEYLDVEEAKRTPGLRLVLTAGVPGPWGESAKGLFHVKGIEYARVRQDGGLENEALAEWTGHDNAPQAVFGDEPARTGWADIVLLAERLAPEPALLPGDPAERALVFGLSHEICGEQGFGWCRRLMMLHPILRSDTGDNPAFEPMRRLGAKYGYDREAGAAAPARVGELLALLAGRLRDQRARGSRYLVGDSLSATDIHWATFAALVAPLPEDLCPMPAVLRQSYEMAPPAGGVDPLLIEHRDFVYENHLELPLDF